VCAWGGCRLNLLLLLLLLLLLRLCQLCWHLLQSVLCR
jgi:hypothetical protein